jgi:hypothetical protein
MKKEKQSSRSPIRRLHSDQYLLLTLLSFAFSVAATRLFLELTGYPQIGGGEVHIAHVLWGGVLLFLAALLPLIYAGRWARITGAILAGLGVGLFIDEVGKFITSSNDYFHPSAAPIVYAVFLLTLLLYSIVSRSRKSDPRTELYAILTQLEEVVDHTLSADERENMLARLKKIRKSNAERDLVDLAAVLEVYLTKHDLQLAPPEFDFLIRLRNWWHKVEKNLFPRGRFRAILIGVLLGYGIWSIFLTLGAFLKIDDPAALQNFLNDLMANRLVRSITSLTWFEARMALEGALGLAVILAAVLWIFGAEKRATALAYASLLLSITVVNLLVFYFDQFSTIGVAAGQFVLLLAVLRYRQRFLPSK